jgi:bla regulator protein BlaR1
MEALNTHLLRFFDWLLWTAIQGSVLIVLIVLIQNILRRSLTVHWHYLLWLLLIVRLASPWLPESKISIFNLVPRSVQQGRIIESYSQSRDSRALGFYLRAQPDKTEQTETASVRFVRVLPTLWLAGTVLIAVYVCARSISLWRTVKCERPITDQKILDLLEDCKMQMRIETIVAVVVSDKIKSPALFGFVRPRLLLPQGMLETYDLEELRYIFIHELAHLRQRDIYLGWLMALLHVAHWFNPLMWFAFSRTRADREIACDRLAMSTMEPDEPPQYGRTIVSLLESFSQTRYLPSVAGILEDSTQVERRIRMIANYKKATRTRWAGAMLLLATLACIVLTNAYVAKADYTFGIPSNLGPIINSSANDGAPSVSADGLSLFFASGRSGGFGGWDIWKSTRATRDDDWRAPVILDPLINSSAHDSTPCISMDGLSLYFGSSRSGFDIWVTTRATIEDDWGEPAKLGSNINTSSYEGFPSISADDLELYFDTDRPGDLGGGDIWMSSRENKDDSWS